MKTPKVLAILMLVGVILSTAMAQENVTLTMWTHDPLYIEYFQKRVDKWNAEHEDIQLTLEAQQIPDPDTAFLTAVAAGEPVPDLLGIEISRFPRYLKDGIVADLFVDLTESVGDRYDDFIEGRWTPYMYEGGIYGIESALSAGVYYYQPDVFKSRGLEPPSTWQEFLEVGRKLAEDDIALSVMTNIPQGPFGMMFFQRGGHAFNENGEFVFGNEENRQIAIEVLKLIREGLDSGTFFLTTEADFWGATLPTAFREGRLAGIVMPDWYSGCCLKPGVESMTGEWRVAPMPVWQDSGYATASWGGTGFAITQASEHKDLAWSLLEDAYLTLDGQLDRYETIGFFPTMYEALEHPSVTETPDPFYGGQTIGAVFTDIARDMPAVYQSPYKPFYLEALRTNLPLFLDGTFSAEEFVDAVVRYTEDEIAFNQF